MCNPTPEFSDILWHPTKNYGPKVFLSTKIKPEYSDILYNPTHFPDPKVFLSTKIKPEYSDILYNPTHFPGPLVCQIGQVPLYLPVPTLLLCCHIYLPVPSQDLHFYYAATYICLSQARTSTSIMLPHIFACPKPGPTLLLCYHIYFPVPSQGLLLYVPMAKDYTTFRTQNVKDAKFWSHLVYRHVKLRSKLKVPTMKLVKFTPVPFLTLYKLCNGQTKDYKIGICCFSPST